MNHERFNLTALSLPRVKEPLDVNRVAELIDQSIGAPLVIVLARLFWPEFEQYRGGVFLDFMFNQAHVDSWLSHLGEDIPAVESVVNHIHLWDFFTETSQQVSDEALCELAEILARCWRCALDRQFSEREFEISVHSDPLEYGPTIYMKSKK